MAAGRCRSRDGGVLYCPDGAAWDRWATPAGLRRRPRPRRTRPGPGSRCSSPPSPAAALGARAVRLGPALGRPHPRRRGAPRGRTRPSATSALKAVEAERPRLRASSPRRAGRGCGSPSPAWCARPRATCRPRGTSVLFRKSRDPAMGPNAFALPGGTIVVTDELVELLGDHEDCACSGVLAHELGHVEGAPRHAPVRAGPGVLGHAGGLGCWATSAACVARRP